MWKYPRMIVWFMVSVVFMFLVRVPFIHAQIIPYYLDFNPGIVLVPLVSVFWGPAGVWGTVAASLLGDWLLGQWGPLTAYRTIGLFLFALSAQRLWTAFPRTIGDYTGHEPGWSPTMRFVLISWPGCLIAAAWAGLGSELLRLYPFPYFTVLVALNNLLFVTVLGVSMYRITARETVPYFGTWRDVMKISPHEDDLAARHVLYIVAGSLGSILIGILAAGMIYSIWPPQPYILGTRCGIWVPVLVIPFLALHLVGITRRL
ncbi:MAG: hypothetical protein KJ626_11685 [Verrucomicrobia bacterium]|nr:hypothetical protein [Verrucomicrobiota bacterium]